MRLAQEAACLRRVGDFNPDLEGAALEEELRKPGNSTGFGAMGFPGDGAIMDVHVEVDYTYMKGCHCRHSSAWVKSPPRRRKCYNHSST